MKTFALKYAKLSKINGQTSVATEASRRLTIKWEIGSLPKSCFSFSKFLYFVFLQFIAQKILRIKKKN